MGRAIVVLGLFACLLTPDTDAQEQAPTESLRVDDPRAADGGRQPLPAAMFDWLAPTLAKPGD